jgi:hypothetical protein
MKKIIIFIFLWSNGGFTQQNYFDLEDDKRIDKGLKSQDPFGINEPLIYKESPEVLNPFQDVWRHSIPKGRMPTSDQDTIAPYNLDKPGIIKDW